MNNILLSIGKKQLELELLDTATAQAVLNNLPFASKVQTWGKEVYFETPVQASLEADARDQVEAGEIAFWCEGSCIVIGYGPTPASEGDEIRFTSACNIWARALGDVSILADVQPGDMVFIEAKPEG